MESISNIIFYVSSFFAIYVQVFFLFTYLENRKRIKTKDSNLELEYFSDITFIIPCWNEEKMISRTVNSLLDLIYPKDRLKIFLVDDGSTDNTWEVMQSYESNPQIKIFKKENGGKHTALNYALQFVDTELVASFDADTTIDQKAMNKVISYFTKDKEVSAVGCNLLIRSPRTIAQKAQSIEYQMFSFTKKILGILGGVLVVPGAFSVFRKKPLMEVGGWTMGHNLEDLELTYRLQTRGYKVEHSNEAIAYTTGPKTVPSLFKQRLRWGYGFIKNTQEYSFAIFNRKFGNFGVFTLPMSIGSYFTILTVFLVSWYKIYQFLYDKFLVIKLVGIEAFFGKFSYSWFFVNTKTLVFLFLFIIIFIIINIMIGRFISKIKSYNVSHIFFFFFLYSLIVPFWVLRSVWNAFRSAKPAWR